MSSKQEFSSPYDRRVDIQERQADIPTPSYSPALIENTAILLAGYNDLEHHVLTPSYISFLSSQARRVINTLRHATLAQHQEMETTLGLAEKRIEEYEFRSITLAEAWESGKIRPNSSDAIHYTDAKQSLIDGIYSLITMIDQLEPILMSAVHSHMEQAEEKLTQSIR